MKEKGFNRDAEQCKAKIKNLKTEYRQAKDNNNKSGRGRKTFKHYDELDAVLGHRPASRPPVVLDATVGGLSVEPSQEGERDSADNNCGKTMTMLCPVCLVSTVTAYLVSYSYLVSKQRWRKDLKSERKKGGGGRQS